MAWVFDHEQLRASSASLLSTAGDLAAARSAILTSLSKAGRYSSSTDRLGSTTSAMRSRAADLDGRVAFLESLAIRVQQPMTAWAHQAVIRIPQISEEDRLLAEVARLSAELSSHPGSWSDADYRSLLARYVAAILELRHHREQLMIGALQNLSAANAISPSVGAWVEVMRAEASSEVHRLSSALGIGPEALLGAASAMRRGISPDAAGLPAYLFPPGYVARMNEAARLEAGLDRALGELEELRAATRVAYWEMQEAEGILMGLVGRDPDYHIKERAYFEALDIERAAADQIAADRARLAELTSPMAGDEVAAFLAGSSFLRPAREAEVVGHYLADEWLAAYQDLAGNEELRWILERLSGEGGLTAAGFFNALGPAQTALTAHQALSPFSGDQEQADATIAMLSGALGEASRSGELEFSGRDLIDRVGGDPLTINVVHPAWLFTYGDFSDEFLIDATLAVIDQGHVPANTGMQLYATEYSIETNLAAVVDARIMLMQQFADLPDASRRLLDALDDEVLFDLLTTDFRDDGIALGDILANQAQLAGPSAVRTTTDLVTALARIESSGDEVSPGVAAGAAAMVAPYMSSFIPSPERQRELGTLYIPGELPTGALRVQLEPGGHSQQTIENLMRLILGHDVAGELFVTNMLLFSYQTLQSATDPANPELRHRYTNDLAALEGLTSAIWIDEHLSNASDQDARDAAMRRWTGLLTSAAVTTAAFLFAPSVIAGSAVYAAVAKFGVGQAIGLGVKELLINEVYPNNHVETALLDTIALLTQRSPYGYAVLQALSDQGALVDRDTGEPVDLSLDLSDLASIDNHALGERLSTLVVIDPVTGLPSTEPEPIDWFTGGAFLTVQELTEVVRSYLDD